MMIGPAVIVDSSVGKKEAVQLTTKEKEKRKKEIEEEQKEEQKIKEKKQKCLSRLKQTSNQDIKDILEILGY